MTAEALSWPGLAVAVALPWAAGAAMVYALLRPTGRFNLPLLAGQGYLAGLFVTTLVIRAWDAAGRELHFGGLCAGVLGVAALASLLLMRRPAAPRAAPKTPAAPPWQLAVVAGLLALLAWRHLVLMQELLGRPLYAWDAWVNWSPKAMVWFHQAELTEFLRPDQWLRQEGFAEAYTLGNWRASTYPETVPLLLLWTMLGAQATDASALYLPWLLAPLALGLGFFGHLRLAGVSLSGSVIAVYAMLSMPYLNVHAALAGYADIWLTCAFGLAVCALYEWRSSRQRAWAGLALLLAAMCCTLKNPGLVLGVILALCVLWGAVNWRAGRLLAAGAVLLGLAAALLVGLDVPGFGRVAVEASQIEAGRLGRFDLGYHPVAGEILDSAFVQINWHLFWYTLAGLAAYCLYRGAGSRLPGAELLAAVAALGFVLFVFTFTSHYRAAENQTTLNRALLYTVPPLLFCAALAWHRRFGGGAAPRVSEKITKCGESPGR